jgi:hypothetical protein
MSEEINVENLTAEKDFYKNSTERLEKKLEFKHMIYDELLKDYRTENRIDRWYWRILFPVAMLFHLLTALVAGIALFHFW